jgi:protein involved in ribonucleotide reduction
MIRGKSLLLCLAFLCPFATQAANIWRQVPEDMAPRNLQLLHPTNFLVYTLDEASLKQQLFSLSGDPSEGVIVSLPLPDGSYRDFKVWQTPMMQQQLAAQYTGIKTFTAEATGNRSITAKLDFTLYGFHAMIFDGANTAFIDPFDNYNDGYYLVHYKKDETRAPADRMKCQVTRTSNNATNATAPTSERLQMEPKDPSKEPAYKVVNGSQLRTYRLALACSHQYAQSATGIAAPSVTQVLSKMTTSMNRINGVYEREFSITMVFAPNENSLIFTTATGDPYGSINSSPGSLLTENQTQCDALIGNGNYDIGHVFTTGAGGLSLAGVVCAPGLKAQSTTGQPTPYGDGFDIDFVAHEIGHEFGADHPFSNGTDGSCGGGNEVDAVAYEPGSGSTIMAYAGICNPDDIQMHSDAYFHTVSLKEINTYLITGGGDACAAKTPTGNKLVGYSPFAATYSIPYLTPFELMGPALTDSVADSATLYCWEEWDLAPAGGIRFINTHAVGPLFRSYPPTPSPLRIFPTNSMVLAGTLSNAGTEGMQGEKVPDVARSLHFICTFRDILNNKGCITIPDDMITLNAINTGTGFAVTSQGTTGLSYTGGSTETVTWDVVNTSVAPISAANVEIYMSLNGGNTWHYHVGTFPNIGSATITLPNPLATSASCRFKIKGTGNVFFNVNRKNFTVNNNPSAPISVGVEQVTTTKEIKIYPVPASNVLHVVLAGSMQATVHNTLGQLIWQGAVTDQLDIPVGAWARGIYYMQLKNERNERIVKRFILE